MWGLTCRYLGGGPMTPPQAMLSKAHRLFSLRIGSITLGEFTSYSPAI